MAMNYQRLTEPLVRDGSGTLGAASGEAALDRAAEGFQRIKTQHGGDALGIFSCSKASNEMNFLASKLAGVAFGSHNVDGCNRRRRARASRPGSSFRCWPW